MDVNNNPTVFALNNNQIGIKQQILILYLFHTHSNFKLLSKAIFYSNTIHYCHLFTIENILKKFKWSKEKNNNEEKKITKNSKEELIIKRKALNFVVRKDF